MKLSLYNILRLGIKELYSLKGDPVLLLLIVYCFTYAIYQPARHAALGMVNASVAIVDEDRSALSRAIIDALKPPYFNTPEEIGLADVDPAMAAGRYTFVITIPVHFEAGVIRARAGQRPALQILADASVITQAGTGVGYLRDIINRILIEHSFGRDVDIETPVKLVPRAKFNANLDSAWLMATNQLINNITLLAMFLAGAALIREREHGTLEHLLVMPLRPYEIMLAKVWANGLVIVCATLLSLRFVAAGWLSLPVPGFSLLFTVGTCVYLFATTSLGIFMATLARTMPQFALLAVPVYIVMNLLSGGITPPDGMPNAVRLAMLLSPSTHFTSFAQAVLYRDADLAIVWPDLAICSAIGSLYFVTALLRFRRVMAG